MRTTMQSGSEIRPVSPAASIGWAFADAWTITQRDLLHWRQRPAAIIISWFFPVMITLMFGLLFGGAISVPAGGSYFEFLMPGMFAMTVLFGLETTTIGVATDASKGITDRFRSMPISSSAVVLGRCIADMLGSIIGLAIMIVSGLLLGWKWNDGAGGFLSAISLLLLLRFALLWVGIYVGLLVKGPESVAPIQILVWPIGFLSSIFVNPVTMPSWLGTIAEWNPLSATSAAIRMLFMNPGWQGDSWVTQHALTLSVIWPLVLIALFLPLSIRRFRQLQG